MLDLATGPAPLQHGSRPFERRVRAADAGRGRMPEPTRLLSATRVRPEVNCAHGSSIRTRSSGASVGRGRGVEVSPGRLARAVPGVPAAEGHIEQAGEPLFGHPASVVDEEAGGRRVCGGRSPVQIDGSPPFSADRKARTPGRAASTARTSRRRQVTPCSPLAPSEARIRTRLAGIME